MLVRLSVLPFDEPETLPGFGPPDTGPYGDTDLEKASQTFLLF